MAAMALLGLNWITAGKDIMPNSSKTPINPSVATARETDDLASVLNLIKMKNTRHAIVLNSQDEISGVFTDRDLELALKTQPGTFPAQRFLSHPVKIAHHDTLLKNLFERMMTDSAGAVLIAAGGEIQHIISAEDLLRVLHRILFETHQTRRDELVDLFSEATAQDYIDHRERFES
jgi:CBS domain-containing protein